MNGEPMVASGVQTGRWPALRAPRGPAPRGPVPVRAGLH